MRISELNKRSLEIFKELVDAYVETGEPIGSRTLSKRINTILSPATIRTIMADLEEAGLLYAPHTSAGRIPTPQGLKFFVHALLQIGDISPQERDILEKQCAGIGKSLDNVLEEVSNVLSGLSKCAGLVLSPKTESPLKHIEFINISSGRGLVILIYNDGLIENRLINIPEGLPPSSLTMASNYLNAKLSGKTLSEALQRVSNELSEFKAGLDSLTEDVIKSGLAVWGGDQHQSLIINGRANLLKGIGLENDLDQLKELFAVLDSKENLVNLLEASIHGDGVQIFIGSENELFKLSGCTLIVAPYRNTEQTIIGALGVIGPSRLNYGKVIPMVDYAAKLIGRFIGGA